MQVETLQELVLGRLTELSDQRRLGLTFRQLARRSAGQLSEATLQAIAAGQPVGLTEAQAGGLAQALDVPAERVVLAAMHTGG